MNYAATVEPTAARLSPVRDRIVVLDVLRGIALLGMFLVHFNDAAVVSGTPSATTAAYQRVVALFFEERFWTMFGILFGVGFAVQLSRADARGGAFAVTYLRRLAVLAAFGLATHVFFGYHVLLDYAMWGVALMAVRRWSIRRLLVLLVISATSWSLYSIAQTAYGVNLTGEAAYRAQSAAAAAANQQVGRTLVNDQQSSDYGVVVAARMRHVKWFYSQPYSFLPVNTLTLFLLGVIGFRLGLFDRPEQHRRLIVALMVFGVVAWAAAFWLLPGRPSEVGSPLARQLVLAEARNTFGLIRETWLSLTYIGGVLLLVARDPAWLRRLAPFAWTGRMALTNYVVQVAILELLFANFALGLHLAPLPAMSAGMLLFAADAVASRWWLRRFRFGPLEWLWRSLTYGFGAV